MGNKNVTLKETTIIPTYKKKNPLSSTFNQFVRKKKKNNITFASTSLSSNQQFSTCNQYTRHGDLCKPCLALPYPEVPLKDNRL